MYIVHESEKIIAFHEDKCVVEMYTEAIYKYHKIKLDIRKLTKREKKSSIKNLYDLYLVRYGETYVQSGYLFYLQLSSDQYIEDEKYARDILYRLLESRNLKEKERRKIEKAVDVLEEKIYDDESYTPTLSELKRMKMDYDPYMYNIGVYP